MEQPSPPEHHTGGSFPKIGAWAWSFVGIVIATIIVVTALAAVSEIALPLLFAAVLAVIFKPVAGSLERHGFNPSQAAGVLVLGLLLLMTVVVTATVRGVLDQTDEIGASVDAAKDYAVQELGLDEKTMDEARTATEDAAPAVGEGVLPAIVSSLGSLVDLRRRPDPGRPDHVLPAEGRRATPKGGRGPGEPIDPRRRERLHLRLVRDPPRLREGTHRDVGDRGRRRRDRQPAARPATGVHDHRGELHRAATSPTSARSSAEVWPSSSPLATAAWAWRRSCSWSCSHRTCCSRTSWNRR